MATKIDDMQSLLKCTICLETFKVPKYLPCLHTFCESCISTLVSSAIEKRRVADFSCPLCRRSVGLDDLKGNVETWAKSLPMNHLMVSMTDRQAIRKSEKLCDSCQFNMETVKAISWCTVCAEGLCKSCEKCHRSFKMTSKHLIKPIDNVAEISETAINIGSMNECIEHPGKALDVYCEDHCKPCCILCATLTHRKCDSVISIEAAATGIKQSKKAIELAEKLNRKCTDIDVIIKNRKDEVRMIENKTSTVLTNVDEIKEKVVKHVNKITDEFKEKVTSSKKNAVISLSDEATEWSSLKCTVDNWRIMFDICLQQAAEQQCLVEMERITQKYIDFENETKIAVSKLTSSKISFEPNKIMSDFCERVDSFGDFSVKSDKQCARFRSGNVTVVNTIDIDFGNESSCRRISGLFLDNCILFTDSENKRIMKYDEHLNYISMLALPREITDITHIESDKVAVASASFNKIYIVDIMEMILLKTITAPTKVYGLQYLDGTFIAAYNRTLTWISEVGEMIEERNTEGDTFFICRYRNNGYMCADGKSSVSFTKDKSKLFTYTSETLTHPRGIDVDYEGNIYIVGLGSGNIHQLSNTHWRTYQNNFYS